MFPIWLLHAKVFLQKVLQQWLVGFYSDIALLSLNATQITNTFPKVSKHLFEHNSFLSSLTFGGWVKSLQVRSQPFSITTHSNNMILFSLILKSLPYFFSFIIIAKAQISPIFTAPFFFSSSSVVLIFQTKLVCG